MFQNTSWVFRQDEQWAILGENGSGKSLLGDAIRGQVPLVGGELTYHFCPDSEDQQSARGPLAGEVFSPEDAIGHVSFDARRREIHDTVLQSRWNSLEEESSLSVAEFLAYERVMQINPFEIIADDGSRRLAFQRRQRRAIALMGVERFRDRTLLTLSNGERQRLELARALCRPLRLLILDEPFTGLDATSRVQLSMVLRRLMSTRLRVLLITTRTFDLPQAVTHVLEVVGCCVRSAGPAGTRLKAPRQIDVKAKARSVSATTSCFSRRDPRMKAPKTRWLRRAGSQAARTPVIELRNVTVRYGSSIVLKRVSWQVYHGESWALLGPNGSGKSTLLSLISGDSPQAYSNDVLVFGRRRGSGESVWELKRRIGQVSPEFHLHFDEKITCLQVVASGFAGTIGTFKPPSLRQFQAARRSLAKFGLLEQARTPLFGLSTGLQRMVLLARALVSEPELLLLDEPCQGLDSAHRRLFIGTVDALIRQHKAAIIYVTHRDDELPRSVNKVFRLGAQ